MITPKKLLACALLAMPLVVSSNAQITLSTFGNTVTDFGDWTYNQTTSTVSGTPAEGDTLFAVDPPASPWDFTSLGSPATLSLRLTGLVTTSPGGIFNVTIGDSLGNESLTSFSWDSFGTTSSSVIVPLNVNSLPDPMDWASIENWNITAVDVGSLNATFTQLEVVPEPSTYALLVLSGLAFGGYMVRRRRRA